LKIATEVLEKSLNLTLKIACLGVAVGRVCGTRWLAAVIGESGFEAKASQIIVSGYSGVCFEIKFSGRHRGLDSVLFNL